MKTQSDLEQLAGAEAFVKTLKNKSYSEAFGQLKVAFNMDDVSVRILLAPMFPNVTWEPSEDELSKITREDKDL
jgi:hypothetical protein